MKNTTAYENMNVTERNIRFVISAAAIIGAMQTSLVGGPLFAAINVLAIALATTAIIGWDPLKAVFKSAEKPVSRQRVAYTDQHA